MTLKGQTRDPNTFRAQYLENYLSYRIQIWCAALHRECRAGAQIIFPESGRGLGHVTPTIFGSTVGYPSDSLASCSMFAMFSLWCFQCLSVILLRSVSRVFTIKIGLITYLLIYRRTCTTGTGTNACYVEKLEKVELWDGDDQPPRQVRVIVIK